MGSHTTDYKQLSDLGKVAFNYIFQIKNPKFVNSSTTNMCRVMITIIYIVHSKDNNV